MDLARFGNFSLPFNNTITSKKYTFEVWIYSQTYVPGKFGSYSFVWNNYLKVKIRGNNNTYASTCYPLYEESYANRESNSFEVPFSSDSLPWVYLRCSVDIAARKFFHFQEKSFTTEQDLNTDLTDVLTTGAASLKFVNENSNRGILFFRLLRLYNCYDCQPVDNYRVNWINIDIIQTQTANNTLLYHVDGRIQNNESIDRSDNNTETVQRLKYIMDNTGVKESDPLPALTTTEFLGYNIIDITTSGKYGFLTTPQSSNYLCPENTYYCMGLIKLNEVNDVRINQVTPSLSGKYTIEFWTMISNVANLTSGFHIIWKGLGSVTLIQDSSNVSSLKMICWPQDFKFDSSNFIEGAFGANVYNLVSGGNISNLEEKLRTSDINNKWLYIRCAVNTDSKKYYANLEDDTILNPTVRTLNDTVPMSPTFNSGDTTYLLLNGMSQNSDCTIYLRNLWLHSNYLPPNNILKDL